MNQRILDPHACHRCQCVAKGRNPVAQGTNFCTGCLEWMGGENLWICIHSEAGHLCDMCMGRGVWSGIPDAPPCDDNATDYADQRTEIAERLLMWAAADQRARDSKLEFDRAAADMHQALSGFSADEIQQLDDAGIVQIGTSLYRVEIGPDAEVALRSCTPLLVDG